MEQLFIKATKNKFRYNSASGKLSTEDLWDLPLMSRGLSLNQVAQTVNKELQASAEESFVTANRSNTILEEKLEIVKHVIAVKLAAIDDAKTAAANKERRELLIDVLEEKEIDELKTLSAKEIKKQIKKTEKTSA